MPYVHLVKSIGEEDTKTVEKRGHREVVRKKNWIQSLG